MISLVPSVVLIVYGLGLVRIPQHPSLGSDSVGNVDPRLGADHIKAPAERTRGRKTAIIIRVPVLLAAPHSQLYRGPFEFMANCSTTFYPSRIIEVAITRGPPLTGEGHSLSTRTKLRCQFTSFLTIPWTLIGGVCGQCFSANKREGRRIRCGSYLFFKTVQKRADSVNHSTPVLVYRRRSKSGSWPGRIDFPAWANAAFWYSRTGFCERWENSSFSVSLPAQREWFTMTKTWSEQTLLKS